MRKLILALLIFTLVACSRQPQTARVCISLHSVENGNITKASFYEGSVLSIIEEASSDLAGLKFTLTNQSTGLVYECGADEYVNIPVGTYSVYGKYTPQITGYMNASVYFTKQPKFEVNETIEVVPNKERYEVTAQYQCFVIAVDLAEVRNLRFYDANNTLNDINCLDAAGVAVTFVCSAPDQLQTNPLRIMLDPCQGYDSTIFRLYRKTFSDGIYVEDGKWYMLHPGQTPIVDGGFIINFPQWVEGSNE